MSARGGLAVVVAGVVWAAACGSDPASPFPGIDFGGGGQGGEVGQGGDGGSGPDPSLGGPCTRDDQCDDAIACTFDACDLDLLRCRFTPDDTQCQNGVYCDGIEQCENKLGCVLGAPITCSDGNPCVINTCDETGQTCLAEPRDVDGDGDPDGNCGGGDCDDLDPTISSLVDEVCANERDDDCDGSTDESDCTAPANDTCLDPLEIGGAGTYPLSTAAATLDYGSSCAIGEVNLARDVVAALAIPPGPVDVQLTARTPTVDVALSLASQCGDLGSEVVCSGSFPHPDQGRVAKVRARSIGEAQAITWPAIVFTEGPSEVTLEVELLAPTAPPPNETCASALVLAPGTPTVASVIGSVENVGTGCAEAGERTGDLVYTFTLTEAQNVQLLATSVDGDGEPILSLRDADCALPDDEITCNVGSAAKIFRHSLAPGTYHVAVAATAPTDVVLTLQLAAATAPPPDEQCAGAPPIPPGQVVDTFLGPYQDDVDTGCLPGAADAAYALDLAVASDVLVVARTSSGDDAAVELLGAACGEDDGLVCDATFRTRRVRARNLAAGSYRVVAESRQTSPMELTAFVRPAVPPTIVPFADDCGDVLVIPPTGGFFQGTTANAQADFDSGCDVGGQPTGGAPDQILELTLPAPKRVVLDMQGSPYSTLLGVRQGAQCPGAEVTLGCASGFVLGRSFLDLELAAGTYWVVVDGYGGQSGPWFLDVHVADP